MNTTINALILILVVSSGSLFGQDYFKTYASPNGLPIKVYFLNNPKPMPTQLLRVDDTKGTIKTSQSDYNLRELKTRNKIARFEYQFPAQTQTDLKKLADEQYDLKVLAAVRPNMYKVFPFHEINPEFLPIHDNCLIYVQALIAMEQYNEALSLLYNLGFWFG